MDELYGTYRVGTKKKKRYLKRSHKKIANLYEQVHTYILHLKGLSSDDYRKETNMTHGWMTKEFLANKYRVPPHEIEQIFQRLNKEGVLSQAIRRTAHDTNRDVFGFGNTTGWAADLYRIHSTHEAWFRAIELEKEDKILRMLEEGYNFQETYGVQNALDFAVSKRVSRSFIDFLLEQGAKPTIDALFASINAHFEPEGKALFEWLFPLALQKGKVNEETTKLYFSCLKHRTSFVPVFLANDYPIHAGKYYGETPLTYAITHKRHDTVKWLLENGANLKKKGLNTPFATAYYTGDVAMVRLFIPYLVQLRKEDRVLYKKNRLRLLFTNEG